MRSEEDTPGGYRRHRQSMILVLPQADSSLV